SSDCSPGASSGGAWRIRPRATPATSTSDPGSVVARRYGASGTCRTCVKKFSIEHTPVPRTTVGTHFLEGSVMNFLCLPELINERHATLRRELHPPPKPVRYRNRRRSRSLRQQLGW